MGLGQGFQQGRDLLAGQFQVADQQVHRLPIEHAQRLSQVAHARQAMAAGHAEIADHGQGLRVLVEQQHSERCGQQAGARQHRRLRLARSDFRGLAQGEGHFLRVPGLGQVAEDTATVERRHRRIQVGIAGEQDAQGLGRDLAGLGEQLGAAHLRHALVADQDMHRLALQALQGAARIALGEHLVLAAELHGQAAQDALFIVDEQDADRCCCHFRRSVAVRRPGGAAGGSGSAYRVPVRKPRGSGRHDPG
ncbi:hypothetical protein D3C84_146650 [compost metagenome]